MKIPPEHLVRALAGQDHFVTCLTYRAAQEELGDDVGVDAQSLRLLNRCSKIIGDIILADGDWNKLGSGFGSHFPGNRRFIIFRPVEAQGEGMDRIRMVPRPAPGWRKSRFRR